MCKFLCLFLFVFCQFQLMRSPLPRVDLTRSSGGSPGAQLAQPTKGKGGECREVRTAQTGRSRAVPIGTAASRGRGFMERAGGSGERPIGAASFR